MHRWQTGREQQLRWRAAMVGFSVFESVVSSTEEQIQHAEVEDMIRNKDARKDMAMEEQAHRESQLSQGQHLDQQRDRGGQTIM